MWVSCTYRGMEIAGERITGDSYGDPGVWFGVHVDGDYIESLTVNVDEEDITEMLTDDARNECCDALLRVDATHHWRDEE